MIAQIKGRLIEKTPTYVIIDCNGVGYQINISLNTYSKIDADELCLLHTHMIVREDAQLLYGFKDKSERELFRLLISVSGVGSATAMMILSSLTATEIKGAISTGDVNTLKGVKGIGAKSAQRIIIDLRDKIGKVGENDINFAVSNNTIKDEALSALIMLGFAKKPAEVALNKILTVSDDMSVEQLIKQTLKSL
ncbi:MAG: Holliday junction branch migration protein RuvA [Flavobacteriales bacterium]|nr:Holliday junction branch migration protein RuvA [Flavobacteriales bacterium]MCW8913777.1 Holliday junction branch migration protein RuvA [Flavobacteriales bacterium]MCW8938872.1 Holliday junction branch migration protein RuvA [Flavobacteriales bacterium]MCW8941400.1 Holliday junction branch migration protein RuvA [Flavobacteriales bacterium]MCW8969328.1 Holliday junction branch migration protein RuvA [Flavobacteriales bacterium]